LSNWKRLTLLLLVEFFLERQRFVVDVASTTSEAAHLPPLFGVGHQLEFECLPTFHGRIIQKQGLATQ
jgi:hypothetical protein